MEADSIRLHKVPSPCRYRVYISSRVTINMTKTNTGEESIEIDFPDAKDFEPRFAHLSNGMTLKYENGKWIDTKDGKEVKLFIN